MGLVARIGLAITRPRGAFALAGDRRHAGRSGSDLLLAIVMLLLATRLRALVAAGWLGSAIDATLGLRAAIHVLTGTLTVDLGILVIGALMVFAAAGPRRDLGRAFDLACVAALPLVVVDLVARIAVHGLDLALPPAATWALSGVAYAWTGALVTLAVSEARRGHGGEPSAEVVRSARPAGWTFVAIAAIGLALQVVWVARNVDRVRPVTSGDPAPAFTLHTIGPQGVLGEPLALSSTAGRVTVIDFWATWCGPCLAALPRLDAFARRHPDVAMLAINLDDPAEARALFDARGYALTLLADDGETSERYGVTTIPHTVVIDRAGHVHRVSRGGGGDLEAELAPLLRP